MPAALLARSHSPLLHHNPPASEIQDELNARFPKVRVFVRDYEPDLIVVFRPDHFNGFFYELMPPFCIGFEACGTGDYGSVDGNLNVPTSVSEQTRIMVDAGCQCVYVIDSAGALIMEEAGVRVKALVDEIGNEAQVGFHGPQNMSFGIANSVLDVRAGARQIDGSPQAWAPMPATPPPRSRPWPSTCWALRPGSTSTGSSTPLTCSSSLVDRLPSMEHGSIVQCQMGVYHSSLLHAAQRYGVPVQDILAEIGRHEYIGGQEDTIIEVAIALRKSGAPV